MAAVVMVGAGMLTMLIYGCVKYNFSGANPLERYEVAQTHRLVVIEGVNVLRTCLYVEPFSKKVFDKGGECELAHLHFQH